MTKRGQRPLVDGEATKVIQVAMPESMFNELRTLADQDSRSMSHVGREAIKQYLFLNQARGKR